MATKTKKKVKPVNRLKTATGGNGRKAGNNGRPPKEVEQEVQILRPRIDRIQVEIQGITPYIPHRFSEDPIKKLKERDGNVATARKVRDPKAETQACFYTVEGKRPVDFTKKAACKGVFGIPSGAIRKAMVSSCRYLNNKKALNMTNSKGMFFVEESVIPVHCKKIVMGEDTTRLLNGSAQIRYRPYCIGWKAKFWIRFCPDLISAESLVNLVSRAGFHVGIGDWRPEKSGDKGTFDVVTKKKR